MSKTTLRTIDLIILKLMVDHAKGEVTPSNSELFDETTKGGLVNEFIRLNRVGSYMADPITGRRTLADAIERLKDAGMIVLVTEGRPYHALTEHAKPVVKRLPADANYWPVFLPVENGKARWEDATYPPEWSRIT